MSEVEFDLLLDAVQTAIVPGFEEELWPSHCRFASRRRALPMTMSVRPGR